VPTRKKKATATPPPLTDDDVADLRARVTAGEKPRVVIRAASAAVPAGTRGNVIRVGKPSADGEVIVVRLGRDDLPFAPTELGLTTRGKAAAAAAEPAPARKAELSRKRTAAARPTATRKTATAAAAAAKPAQTKPAAAKPAATKPAPTKRTGGRRGSSRRTSQPLTVTLRFANDAWTVEAQRGARRLAKASPLRPGAVKAFADLVDEENVRDALTETVESCRAVVEERAQRLRAELQAAEDSLREYDARRR
jgi:hypothetical protein